MSVALRAHPSQHPRGITVLMHVAKLVSVNGLTLFYVRNLVILLMVVAWISHHSLRPWAGFHRARKILIIGLGSLWIVDGLL